MFQWHQIELVSHFWQKNRQLSQVLKGFPKRPLSPDTASQCLLPLSLGASCLPPIPKDPECPGNKSWVGWKVGGGREETFGRGQKAPPNAAVLEALPVSA